MPEANALDPSTLMRDPVAQWLALQRAKNTAEGVGDDNLLTPTPAAARPIWSPDNSVGTSQLRDTYAGMPSPDVSPVIGAYGAHPVTAAMRANALNIASMAAQFGPADVGAIRGFRMPPVHPPGEDIGGVIDANFNYGKDLGPATQPIDTLIGGITANKTEAARVDDLKTRIAGNGGFISRLLVDTDGNVLEGQHRLEALRQLGATQVPVHVVKDLAAGIDTGGVETAIKSVQQMHGDQRHRLIAHLLDVLHDEGGSVVNVRDGYEAPRGYEQAWQAALDYLGKPQQ